LQNVTTVGETRNHKYFTDNNKNDLSLHSKVSIFMKISFTRLYQTNWFFIATLLFVISLPFSNALISISGGLLLAAALFSINKQHFKSYIHERKLLFFAIGVYLIYLGWLIFTNDWKWATYDLRKNMAYLTLPLAFILGTKLSILQYKRILRTFSFAVVVSATITLIQFYLTEDHSILNAQHYGFMHHIRFSLQIDFSILILIQLFYEQRKSTRKHLQFGIVAALLILFSFLLWHQSLTGIITLVITFFVALAMWITARSNKKTKLVGSLILVAIVVLPAAYLYYAINKYYTIDKIDPGQLKELTSEGNKYSHNLKDKSIENGHYVWLYVCDKELEREWNKRSELKYNTKDRFGYNVKYTIIRYLASKNLRKDALGVKALTDDDVKNIENGISNYILADKSISLYPRIYISIWELDTYWKTGNANHRSLAQRLEYTKAAFSIINDNFWMGVGTGNWKQAYRDFYINSKSRMAPARYGNVHNQYLNYMVKFGIVGLLLVLFFLLYPVIKSKSYRNHLFLFFLVIMLVGNFGDANFETHTGSHFFMFFYCLFLVPKSD